MNIVLAGYGNIGKALHAMLQTYRSTENVVICELSEGTDCVEYVKKHAADIDLLVNLTSIATEVLISLCNEYGIAYIDTTIVFHDDKKKMYDHYLHNINRQTSNRLLFGCGMNPGLIEHIYQQYSPKRKHIAIQIDFDEAESGDEIFGTWSPYFYYQELLLEKPTAVLDGQVVKLKPIEPVTLSILGAQRELLPLTHEESYSICRDNPWCDTAAFFYQAPIKLQRYLLSRGPTLSQEELDNLPVKYDVSGRECIGMLFYDIELDRVDFAYTIASHQDAYAKYGTNATCWQTACGVFTTIELMQHIPRGTVATMTDLSKMYPDLINQTLELLGFKMYVQENIMSSDLFKQKILSQLLPFNPQQPD